MYCFQITFFQQREETYVLKFIVSHYFLKNLWTLKLVIISSEIYSISMRINKIFFAYKSKLCYLPIV